MIAQKCKVNAAPRIQETRMECHKPPKLQVLSPLGTGFGAGAAPQNTDEASTGVNIAAAQGIKTPHGGYHLARALLFSDATYEHCVFIRFVL